MANKLEGFDARQTREWRGPDRMVESNPIKRNFDKFNQRVSFNQLSGRQLFGNQSQGSSATPGIQNR